MRAKYLRSLLDYNPNTGHLTWKRDTAHLLRGQTDRIGKRAGESGTVSVNGQSYATHIVIWTIHYGSAPIAYVQFRDKDKTNTRIDNLFDSGSKTRRMCTACGFIGGGESFYANSVTISGLASQCKSCSLRKTAKPRLSLKEGHKIPPLFCPPIVQRSLGKHD